MLETVEFAYDVTRGINRQGREEEKELSRSEYSRYDAAGNLVDMETTVFSQGESSGYKQKHHYSYELWSTYLQSVDDATLDITGQATTTGKSQRIYDMNSQLKDAIDSARDDKGVNTSTHYVNSSLEGLRTRQDGSGQTNYLTVAGKTIGDLHVDAKGKVELDIYSGFTPTGTPEVGFDAWKMMQNPTKEVYEAFRNGVQEASLPNVAQDNLGTWTLQVGDTLESVALQVYGDSSLWYLIADANGITERNAQAGEKGSQLRYGQQLNIPPAASQHHNSSTKKVLSSSDLIGNLSATTPLPPAPPPPKKHGPWRILAIIAIAVVATFATVMTAGVFSAMAGGGLSSAGGLSGILALGNTALAGTITSLSGAITSAVTGFTATLTAAATTFTAGFVGSAVGQGLANLAGLQKGFDLTGALITGVAAATTAIGFNHFISGNKLYDTLANSMKNVKLFNLNSATTMMEQDIISQGLNTSFRRHQKMDWLDITISAASAGIMGSQMAEKYNSGLKSTFKSYAKTADSEIRALATSATSAIVKGGHFNAAEVLINNLGAALANNVIDNTVKGQQALVDGAVAAAKEQIPVQEAELMGMGELVDGATSGVQSSEVLAKDPYEDLSFSSDLYPSSNDGEHVASIQDKLNVSSAYGKKQFIADSFTATELEVPDGRENNAYHYATKGIESLLYTMPVFESINSDHFSLIQSLVLGAEGGVSKHPNDSGGYTNRGITIGTFKKFAESDLGIKPTLSNLRDITAEQATIILKKRFWNVIRGDEIESLGVAHVFYDMHVNSSQAVRLMQESVNQLGGSLVVDNKMGPKTISEINKIDAQILHEVYKDKRIDFYNQLVIRKPNQKVFEKGWIDRVNAIKYRSNDEWH